MKITLNEMKNGELAVRRMSEKARKVYEETDPATVAEYKNGDDLLYYVDVAGNSCEGLTFEEAEKFLEDNYLEIEEEGGENDD